MATLVDLADAEYPKTYGDKKIKPSPGKSLLPTFRQPEKVEERSLFWEHEKHAAIREGEWKLVTEDASRPNDWELYDLSKSRSETRNQAGKMPAKVEAMQKKWTAWAKQANVLPWPRDRK